MQPAGKVQSFGLEGCRYSEGGQMKSNFSLFSFLCVCVCVCEKYFWLRETISPLFFFSLFFFFCCFFFLVKKCGYPGFFVHAM